MSSEANVAKLMNCLDQAVEDVERLELQLSDYDSTLEVRSAAFFRTECSYAGPVPYRLPFLVTLEQLPLVPILRFLTSRIASTN